MAGSQHHVSKRSALDFLKKAAFLLVVISTWAAMMATAEGIDRSNFLTAVVISTSAEAKTSRTQTYHPIIQPIIYSKETNNSNNNNKIKLNTEVKHILGENVLENPKTLKSKKASPSGKLKSRSRQYSFMKRLEIELKTHSKASLSDIVKEPTASTLYPHWNTRYRHTKSLYENRHSIRRRKVESNKCPKIQDNKSCFCTEFQILCDALNISVLEFLEPLPVGVRRVSFARNHLRSIPVISGAPDVLELFLAQNEIEVANVKELGNLTKLEKLDLSSNKLEELDLSEGKFLNLLNLNASFNKLRKFESQPLRLTHLFLQQNMLSNVCFVSRFRLLRYLNLSFNRITYVPSDVFQNLTDLYLLDLKNNQIINGDFVLFITRLLHTLAMSNNRVSSLPIQSFRNSKVVELYLDNNTLTDVSFLIYSNAAEINLNDNQLSTLNGKLFQDKKKLKVLNVSGMKLTSMEFITNIPSLVSVGMESNNISCLPKGFLKNYKTLNEWFLLDNPLEDLICPISSERTVQEICNIRTSNSKVQIRMKDININDIMRCILDHRDIFEDCEQKCNFASHTLFTPLLIFVSTLFNVI